MKRNSVNVLSVINSKNITTETIDGDEHIVVRDIVPVVDDIVMNKGLYPADEIDKGYNTLDGKLMPFGHPKIDGKYISANEAVAVNKFYVGAWCVNARKEGDKVLIDMKVNKRIANSSESGQRLIERLDGLVTNQSAEPIHISTGLNLQREYKTGHSKGKKYDWIATNMQFDHVAILLDEQGAATPDDGVGIFVNKQGEELAVETVNLAEAADCTKETLLDKVRFFFSANSKLSFSEIHDRLYTALGGGEPYKWIESVYPDEFIYEESGKRYKQKYLIDDNGQAVFAGVRVEVVKKVDYDEIKTNGENNVMKNKILSALNAAGVTVEGLDDDQLLTAYNELQAKPKKEDKKPEDEQDDKKLDEKIKKAVNEALKPIAEQLQANANAEQAQMREAVKAKFGMSESAVNALNGEALTELYAKTQSTAQLNPAFKGNTDDGEWNGYTLNTEENQ
ncbi:hypothetical protein SAMN05660772_02789 [Pasteurella testudinis DSM 23072]|uniref:DUF2213 domain-containing protein n=1 Tax=Pasteurella testudinis DSM 23072 TaxID=1122938 RepID=A0A1W1V4S2_9PAST|nr:DUF2213 domain-containing protein [Pasteurella testudinis]SMB87974.1 hypothetical protein SAMN05660772_02789 [Pasteurella testudinis DSM 23072]SUB51629.1 Uncharacterised protein [Pasteurella testudinis]